MLLCNIFSCQHFVDKDYTIVKYICILLSLEYRLHHHELLMSDILFKSNNYFFENQRRVAYMRQIIQAVTKKMDSMHVRVSRFFLIYVCVFVCRSTLCSDNSSSKLDTLYLSLYGKHLKSGLHVCE